LVSAFNVVKGSELYRRFILPSLPSSSAFFSPATNSAIRLRPHATITLPRRIEPFFPSRPTALRPSFFFEQNDVRTDPVVVAYFSLGALLPVSFLFLVLQHTPIALALDKRFYAGPHRFQRSFFLFCFFPPFFVSFLFA